MCTMPLPGNPRRAHPGYVAEACRQAAARLFSTVNTVLLSHCDRAEQTTLDNDAGRRRRPEGRCIGSQTHCAPNFKALPTAGRDACRYKGGRDGIVPVEGARPRIRPQHDPMPSCRLRLQLRPARGARRSWALRTHQAVPTQQAGVAGAPASGALPSTRPPSAPSPQRRPSDPPPPERQRRVSVARSAWSCEEREHGDHADRVSDGLPADFSPAVSGWARRLRSHLSERAERSVRQ
jgi:hypothetical protein